MIKLLDKILNNFKERLSRQVSFNWFVVIIIVLMIGTDTLDFTSIIRDFCLNSKGYESIIHFFILQLGHLKPFLINGFKTLNSLHHHIMKVIQLFLLAMVSNTPKRLVRCQV